MVRGNVTGVYLPLWYRVMLQGCTHLNSVTVCHMSVMTLCVLNDDIYVLTAVMRYHRMHECFIGVLICMGVKLGRSQ
jgi:hypothetical protein